MSDTVATQRRFDFQETILDNGLRVLTLEDFFRPVVAVHVWYHVGSKNEDSDRQGFAHMFEHMMFRGTERLGPKDHFESVYRCGGTCNAFTSFDTTAYVNEVPAEQLDLVLWLEAERMAFLRIDDEGFDTERKVVEEEYRLRVENAPYGRVPEKVLATVFRKHPYRWPPAGNIPHLRAATVTELRGFWDTYYVPGNAVLVVVGAVTHSGALAAVQRHFGWMPRCPEPPRNIPEEPPQAVPLRLKVREKKGPAPVVGFLFRTVPQRHRDWMALELLTNILGDGESSRLNRDLVKRRRICQAAVAGQIPLEDEGLTGAGAVLMPWGRRRRVMDGVWEHIQRIRSERVTERELEKVRNQMLRREVIGALTVEEKATALGLGALMLRDAERLNSRLAEISRVTPDDLLRVAREYLSPERRTAVRVEPGILGLIRAFFRRSSTGESGQTAQGNGATSASSTTSAPSTPSPSAAAPENALAAAGTEGLVNKAGLDRPEDLPSSPPFAEFQVHKDEPVHHSEVLDNGLKVIWLPYEKAPFAGVTLGFKCGAWSDIAGALGGAAMTLGMLTEGTERRSSEELAELVEFEALTLGGLAEHDAAEVSTTCLVEKLPLALDLLCEVVTQPAFPEREFHVLRRQAQMQRMMEERDPAFVASRVFLRQIYGDHPYSRLAGGSPGDLKRLTPEHLRRWWARSMRPDAAVLLVSAPLDREAALRHVTERFGSWQASGDAPAPALTLPDASRGNRIFLVDRKGAVQSQVRVGHVNVARSHADHDACEVLTEIFGNAFNSRLNKSLRLDTGLTYAVRGGFSANRFGGEFSVSTFTQTERTAKALEVILEEIRDLRERAPTADELDVARGQLAGSFASRWETPEALISEFWTLELDEMGPESFAARLETYRQATPEGLTNVARRRILPDNLTIVVVGDSRRLRGELEEIAPVTVLR